MRFVITRLCGGNALMVASRDEMTIDIEQSLEKILKIGELKSHDEMMAVFVWNGMEVTLYPQGKVMFHPLSDRKLAVEYATDILEIIT